MSQENEFSEGDERSSSSTPGSEYASPGNGPTEPDYALKNNGETSTSAPPRASTPSPVPVGPALSPKERFRQSVHKIIKMHRSMTVMTSGRAGAEPGVDPRKSFTFVEYGHVKEDCAIEVADYSAVRTSFRKMSNKEFVDFVRTDKRESWAKIRWINIGGISWDVISALGIEHDLHPLSIEDVLHKREQNQSKVDYFQTHLFLRILCHSLDRNDDKKKGGDAGQSGVTALPRSSSPDPFTAQDEKGAGEFEAKIAAGENTLFSASVPTSRGSTTRRRRPLVPNPHLDLEKAATVDSAASDELVKTEIKLEELKKEDRVPVKVSPMFIFLLRNGTVISMHPDPDLSFTAPITQRLRQMDSGLRTSTDPSLLVESLLDLIVDRIMEVVDEYQVKIRKFEQSILLKPKMRTVQNLHILSGDLILHKRTLEPIKTVIYGLRRYDTDRCAALIDTSVSRGNVKAVGYMSHKSKIYLAEVYDHMDHILTNLDLFASIAENLINYTFNTVSYQTNEVMRRLTLATIICLPLTFLTGYCGMNFKFMWLVHDGHSDLLFWAVALPMMAIVIPMFIMPDIKRMVHYVQKEARTRQAYMSYKMT